MTLMRRRVSVPVEVELLTPATIGGNGYRYYRPDELLRLQEILILRELDLGLSEIAEILNQPPDRVQTLRNH